MPGARPVKIDDGRSFARVIAPGALLTGWSRVRANQGASGGDGVTVARFEQSVERRVADLSDALARGDYRPGPHRRVEIPKGSGGTRTLSIPCVVDRVAQTSAQLVLSPLIEPELEDDSYAYRPGRGVDDAVRRVAALRAEGFHWVLDADIEAFFDRVPHDGLLDRLAETMTEGPLTELIALWLSSAAPTGRGLPQGSPLSPLLANLYLDRVDERLSGRNVRLVRYADDFVVLAKTEAGAMAALEAARRALAELGLVLHPEKTRVLDFDRGLAFLGHLFVRGLVLKKGPAGDGPSSDEAILADLARRDHETERREVDESAKEEVRREAGLEAAFRVLHLRSPDRRLDVRNTAFSVQAAEGLGSDVRWREILAVPHQALDRIDLWPGTDLTLEARRHALSTDTLVALVGGSGRTEGWLAPSLAPRAERRLAQARLVLDPVRRLDLARRIVDGRIRNQRALLRRLNRNRSDVEVASAARALGVILRRLPEAGGLSELMGYEGQAGALYWPALARCAPGHTFHKRDRPASDPLNLILNFTAWLLERDVATAASRVDLDPGLGVLHQTRDRGDALVFDLMEEFRAPLAESVTLYVFNNRILSDRDFEWNEATGLRLGRRGGDALIRAYEAAAERVIRHPGSGRRGAWRTMMVEQAYALAAHVEGRRVYHPLVMDY